MLVNYDVAKRHSGHSKGSSGNHFDDNARRYINAPKRRNGQLIL
jgi:hypothetical protein